MSSFSTSHKLLCARDEQQSFCAFMLSPGIRKVSKRNNKPFHTGRTTYTNTSPLTQKLRTKLYFFLKSSEIRRKKLNHTFFLCSGS